MQEDKNLNKESDYSRFMPPPIPKENISEQSPLQEYSNVHTPEMNKEIDGSTKEDENLTYEKDINTEEVHTDITPATTLTDTPRYSDNPYEVYENHIPGYNDTQSIPERNNMGISGFVVSIVAFLLFWVPIMGGIFWLLGLIFSCMGLTKKPKGLAIAGLVISLIGLLFFIARMVMLFVSALSEY